MKGSLFQERYLSYLNKNLFFITFHPQMDHNSLTSCKYGPLSNVVQQQRNNEHDDFQLKNRGFSLFICWKEIKKIKLRKVRVLLGSFAKGMKVRSLEFVQLGVCERRIKLMQHVAAWNRHRAETCSNSIEGTCIAQGRGFAMHRIISSTYMVH